MPPLPSNITPAISDAGAGDPPFKIGVATSADWLPAAMVPGWYLARRLQVKFDGAGGVLSLGRAEAQRAELPTTGPTASGRAPHAALIKRI